MISTVNSTPENLSIFAYGPLANPCSTGVVTLGQAFLGGSFRGVGFLRPGLNGRIGEGAAC
jgi:hypothetical protein